MTTPAEAALAEVLRFEDDMPHAHEVEGMWDESNGPPLGGQPCERCAAFAAGRAALTERGAG